MGFWCLADFPSNPSVARVKSITMKGTAQATSKQQQSSCISRYALTISSLPVENNYEAKKPLQRDRRIYAI